jgi:hypothetical protein
MTTAWKVITRIERFADDARELGLQGGQLH